MTDAGRQYLELVKNMVRQHRGRISESEQAYLDRHRERLQLTPPQAKAIEDHVLQVYQRLQSQPQPPSPAPSTPQTSTPATRSSSSRTHEYETNLDRYRHEFAQAIRQQYPPDELTWNALKQLQHSLQLRSADVQQVEAEQVLEWRDMQEAYQQKLRWYEEEYTKAVDENHHNDRQTQEQLRYLQQDLRLNPDDVITLERQILSSRQIDPATRFSGNPFNSLRELSATTASSSEVTRLPGSTFPLNPTQPQPYRSRLDPPDLEPPLGQLPEECQDLEADLKRYLESSQWQQADRTTARLMLRLADREQAGWLDQDSLAQFPCEALDYIDRLWAHYSKHKFGFRVQYEIYNQFTPPDLPQVIERSVEQGVEPDPVAPVPELLASPLQIQQFSEAIGWWRSDLMFYKYYKQLTFETDAVRGHLPARWFWKLPWWKALQLGGIGATRGGCRISLDLLPELMKQLRQCNTMPHPVPHPQREKHPAPPASAPPGGHAGTTIISPPEADEPSSHHSGTTIIPPDKDDDGYESF